MLYWDVFGSRGGEEEIAMDGNCITNTDIIKMYTLNIVDNIIIIYILLSCKLKIENSLIFKLLHCTLKSLKFNNVLSVLW